MASEILTEESGGWIKIVLNRPERLNAFNVAMHGQLMSVLDSVAESQAIRSVLITGAGRGFCAGQDLGDRNPALGKVDLGETLRSYYVPLIKRLRSLEVPIVCAVNGVAAGAGVSLALACDIVLAGKSAKFIQSFVNVGLIPDSGSTYFLPKRVGSARAMGMALLGEPVPAAQAETWGLIWKAVDDDQLASASEALALHLASQPTFAIGLIKAALRQAEEGSLESQLELEQAFQRRAGFSEDYSEGVRAFFEKRPAKFTGR